jgi:putative membrane protein
MTTIFIVYLHFLGVIALFALLFTQILLFRPDLGPAEHRRLVLLDLAYGGAAALVLLTGLARVFLSGAGAGFYFSNPTFHFMGAAFVIAAVLSLYPTRRFIRRGRELRAGRAPALAPDVSQWIVRIQYAELALLLLALWFAILMARGLRIGYL